MKYAKLKLAKESNTCANGRVIREQVLRVVDAGAVVLNRQIHHLHPVHIGCSIKITSDLHRKLNQTLSFI